jgi:hypothetical protein
VVGVILWRHHNGTTNSRRVSKEIRKNKYVHTVDVIVALGRTLDSAVMTTWAERYISYGLIRIVVLGR